MDLRIVLPPVWPGVFCHVAELLLTAAHSLRLQAEVVEAEVSTETHLNIVIGWSVYEPVVPQGAPYVIYQLEPLHVSPWPQRLIEAERLFAGALAVWDYSQNNLPMLHSYANHWLPLRYHRDLHRSEPRQQPQWDVLFTGNMTPRRHRLLLELSRHCCVTAQQRWGAEFEKALQRAKILLNIHQTDVLVPLEQPRVAFALNNDCFVLTETSADQPYPQLPSAPYEDLIEVALHYLYNPTQREKARLKSSAQFKRMPTMTEVLSKALTEVDILPSLPTAVAE